MTSVSPCHQLVGRNLTRQAHDEAREGIFGGGDGGNCMAERSAWSGSGGGGCCVRRLWQPRGPDDDGKITSFDLTNDLKSGSALALLVVLGQVWLMQNVAKDVLVPVWTP